jgi:predicted esterase
LEQSAKVIIEILKEESTLVPYDRIFLGGLSQGCAMSLSVLLSLDRPLGGFVGMSGWLPFQQDIAELINEDGQDEGDDNPFGADENETHPPLHPMITAANFQRQILSTEPLEQSSDDKTALLTPIFIGHGEADEKVHCRLGHDAVQTIRAVGMDVTWKVYPGQGHWYKIPEEIEDILQFLRLKTGLVFAGVDN